MNCVVSIVKYHFKVYVAGIGWHLNYKFFKVVLLIFHINFRGSRRTFAGEKSFVVSSQDCYSAWIIAFSELFRRKEMIDLSHVF